MDHQDHDQEPRIVARGEWSQDEFGDILYTPAGHRPCLSDDPDHPGWDHDETDEAPAAARPHPAGPETATPATGRHHPFDPYAEPRGYRPRSDDLWERARADYLAGDSASAVCDRYDLSVGTLKSRAYREGWRRCDQAEPEPVDLEAERASGLPDPAEMAAHALVRAERAVQRGRPAEAGSWLRLHQRLAAIVPPPEPKTPAPKPEPTPRAVAPKRAPDLYTETALRARALEGLARDVAAMAPDNREGQARLEALLARMGAATETDTPGPISDVSDHSTPVSSAPAPERPDDPGGT